MRARERTLWAWKKACRRGLAGALDLFERWPAGQEVAEQRRVRVSKPVERLRKVLLQGVGQAIGEAGLVADQPAALFDQAAAACAWHRFAA